MERALVDPIPMAMLLFAMRRGEHRWRLPFDRHGTSWRLELPLPECQSTPRVVDLAITAGPDHKPEMAEAGGAHHTTGMGMIMAQSDEIVVRTKAAGFRTEIIAGGHTLIADEPTSLGGTGGGPTPYDYLAAALGACTSMTIWLYANRRGWALKEITVRLRHSRVHERDCEDCERDEVGIDRLERDVELSGHLTPEQRLGLLRLADRCPVAQTLARGIRVVPLPEVAATSPTDD